MKLVLNIVLLLFSISQISFGQDSEHFANLAKQKYDNKEYNYALTLIEKAIEKDTLDIWNRLLASEILIELKRSAEAETQLLLATQIENENPEPYNRLGSLYLSRNDLSSSLKMYDRAIQYEESDTIKFNYYVNRASAKAVLRDFDGAVEDFEAAYEIDETNIAVMNNLAALYSEIGLVDKGISLCKKTIELYPNFIGGYVNLGMTYSEIDSLSESEYYFDLAIKIDPNDPLLFNNRGFLHYKKKDYHKALADINKSLDIYPNNSYAYRNRALVYLALELKKESCRDLETAIYYDFETRYGDEVNILYKENCE